ncbi:hypothetical protein EDB83DRAFT_2323934 [Lactarius deliciosus]|nr:hypothetical protein EDB83DRAFT_2323934 [Lactarius deliciosus]
MTIQSIIRHPHGVGHRTVSFQQFFHPNTTFFPNNYIIDGDSNPNAPGEAGIEANLDVQYTVGIASGVPTVFISVGNMPRDSDPERLLELTNAVLHQREPTQAPTTSTYGMKTMPWPTTCGVASRNWRTRGQRPLLIWRQRCIRFTKQRMHDLRAYLPVQLPINTNPETSAPAVELLSDAGVPIRRQSSLFGPSGRGFPNVSAAGTNLTVVWKGNVTSVEGTSSSDLVFASVVSLLNDRLIAAGRRLLGFLSPFLCPQGARALNDITTGRTPDATRITSLQSTGDWTGHTELGKAAGRRRAVIEGLAEMSLL